MAQAVKTHLDNSLVTFLPLGLGQLYRVLQGCKVDQLLPSSCDAVCRLDASSLVGDISVVAIAQTVCITYCT